MTATLEQIARAALSSVETVLASYDIACNVMVRDIPGDLVECGVGAGAQCAAMALAMIDQSLLRRRVHLFDSFKGVPACGKHDTEWIEAGHKPGLSATSLLQVQRNMEAWGIDPSLLVYHRGLFRDTVPAEIKSGRLKSIAVLRLDGDLYESTRDCMPLYDLVSPGGWIIVDDWALSGARKAVEEKCKPGPIYFQRHP